MGHKRKDRVGEEITPEVVPPASAKKEKKRREREAILAEADRPADAAAPEEPIDEPPKKKRKNRTSFEDPRIDTTLPGQARKALEYAFLQMNRPSKWKFNKAKQNWLVRNLWSPEQVPDVYFPLALEYVRKIQGGSREKLKETCGAYLKPEPEPPVATSPTITSTETKAGPLISIPSAATAQPIVPIEAKTPSNTSAEARRVRAQQVLDVLQSNV